MKNLAKQKFWITLPLLASITLVAAACGEVKKIDDMRTNTGEMNKTTKDLLDATGEMKGTTDGMRATTERMAEQTGTLLDLTESRLVPRIETMESGVSELYDALRQGDAANLRHTLTHSVLNSQNQKSRLAEAGLFFMSFEYQLFDSSGQDKSQERRLVLYHQAMMEFMLRIDELAPRGGRIWPEAKPNMNRASEQNKASAFNAFVATMHKLNRKQGADPDFGHPVSAYDLIIASLKAKPGIDSGQLVLPAGNHYMKEVLSRPERVKQILQTRYNLFVYLLLGATTDLDEKNKLVQLYRFGRGINIDLNSQSIGSAHLDFITEEILQYAVQTRMDMIALGIEPKFSNTTRLIANRIRIVPSREQGALADKQKRVIDLWSEYIGNNTGSNDGVEAVDIEQK